LLLSTVIIEHKICHQIIVILHRHHDPGQDQGVLTDLFSDWAYKWPKDIAGG